ncbi:Asp23/Gls24 family envelope stress response protein [Naasia lichenicola]|uniref:Asp23/Gls24 family envelope stress response protein n=1 Tax=Naasia lichenicola TaxID=2565933 RepID=A0A4S4FLC8_9MICO|nr:Asp23/Gls24 family envelope stress response protein [Naasia lichenicola]THG30006.1 Asp23/Gls24 family envelope stress response protein [Naasia lichenicola]
MSDTPYDSPHVPRIDSTGDDPTDDHPIREAPIREAPIRTAKALGFEPDELDGHTIEELSDYLDRDGQPVDPAIESSPDALLALAALRRLRDLSGSLIEADARAEPPRDDSWISGILANISIEARAGRDIPISHTSPTARLSITEGAVRGLIRAAGDSVEGVLVGRCRLEGDVTIADTPIAVTLEVAVLWGEQIPETTARLRSAVYSQLLRHTELRIASIDITVTDVQFSRAADDALVVGPDEESE